MSVLSILLNWISDLTDPMKGFRGFAMNLNDVHSDAMQAFRQYIYQLDPNQALQQNTIISGDLANAIQQTANDFLQTDIDLSAFESQYNVLLDLIESLDGTATAIEGATETTALELEGDSLLLEITADVDIAAVAEGGANPIADVAGIILTLVAGAEIIDSLKNLAEDIYNDVQRLKADMHNLEMAVYPPTPPEPTHVTIKPPDWQSKTLDAQQQISLSTLMAKYGYLAGGDPAKLKQLENSLESFLKMGLNQADIEKIMGNLTSCGVTNDEILAFLNGIVTNNGSKPNSPSADKIKYFFSLASRSNAQYPLAQIVRNYANIAAIPGASRLLTLVIETSANEDKYMYRGYQFELQWTAAHSDQIARIEDIVQAQKDGEPVNRNVQAADVVFKSGPFTKGAIVDTKSLSWVTYDKNQGKIIPVPQKDLSSIANRIIIQAQRDEALYPGYPLVYVFDSNPKLGEMPKSVIQKLTNAGITVMTSPPDKVVGVGQPPQPQNNSSDNSNPQIPSGGDPPPQIPSPGSQSQLPPGN